MNAVGRSRSSRRIGAAGTAEATVVHVAEAFRKLSRATAQVVPAVVHVRVALMRHVADLVTHAGAQAHAAVIQRGAVERGVAVVCDGAVEELVTFADTLFTLATRGVLARREVAVAVFLAGLVGDALAVT